MSLDIGLSYHIDGNSVDVFDRNITHNLGEMAEEAGIYKALWRPDENGFEKGSDLIPVLEAGMKDLKERPEYFMKFDAPNGWGMYIHFVPFVEAVLEACKKYPNALIWVSR